jgi:nitrous oxidase accessory protein
VRVVRGAERLLGRAALGAVLALSSAATVAGAQDVVVSSHGPVRSLTEAVRRVPAGGRIVVKAGVYREPTIIVNKRVTIVGEGNPVLDGHGEREIMTIIADSVTVRGLVFRDVGSSYREDRAAIRVQEANGCVIDGNRFERAFFGIYLARVSGCRITHNTILGQATTEAASGNGIHLWTADHITITDNIIRGHRDGIYFEFVHFTDVDRNLSEENLRYGLHFMFSDECRYRDNVFRQNGSGVAVMYTKHVEMTGNRLEQNWGAAAYGLLLKEIADVRLERNVFSRNTTGLMADGTTRLTVVDNRFADNGWAIQLDANTQTGRVAANDFVGNTFDVATNGSSTDTVLEGNYWDAYRGYDLKRDGYGDVPFRPVRLFSVLVERNSPALILLRSAFVALLDVAERVVPALTPDALADARPAMRPLHGVVRTSGATR